MPKQAAMLSTKSFEVFREHAGKRTKGIRRGKHTHKML
jgi:hypothetical protein